MVDPKDKHPHPQESPDGEEDSSTVDKLKDLGKRVRDKALGELDQLEEKVDPDHPISR